MTCRQWNNRKCYLVHPSFDALAIAPELTYTFRLLRRGFVMIDSLAVFGVISGSARIGIDFSANYAIIKGDNKPFYPRFS